MDRRSFLIASALATASRALQRRAVPDVLGVRLSSLTPRLANQGWGSLLYDRSVDNKPMMIAGRRFDHGVSTHARSDLVYLVAGRYASFRAWVGVDPAPSRFTDGTAVFQVFADGKKLFESPVMKADTPARFVDVELGNANVLRLIVTYVGAYADHVNWAEAELQPSVPAANLSAKGSRGPRARRVDSGRLAFFLAGNALSAFTLPNGRRIELQGSGGMGAFSNGGSPNDGVSRFRSAPGGLRWDWEYRSSSAERWTAPVDTSFRWPTSAQAKVWMPWGHGWQWQDPLEPRPFEDKTRDYGAFFNREHGVSLPMATIIDQDAGVGVSFIQSPDDVLLDLQISTTTSGEVRFSRAFNRFGGGSPKTSFHMDIVVHEPDVRSALRAIVERYPAYFDAPNGLAHEIGGGGAYSGWEGELDTAKMTAMGFTMNWKASIDFPYMGLFLPPLGDDVKWNRFAGGGEGPHTAQDEGRYGQTTIRHMNDYSAEMRQRGFYVLNYFNVTEFGTNIVYPPPAPTTADDRTLWRDSNDLLHSELESAVLKTPNPIYTWGKGVIMDCGDPAYRRFLVDQARRHVERLPDSSGICIDRMDWLTRYNPNADDGVSWIDGQSRHLRRSWMSLLDEIGPVFHDAGKVIFGNDMDRRLELMRQVDGFYDEHGHYPFNLNASAFLSLRKPLVCWTPDDPFQPDVDTYFQRLLYLGAFPTVPYPGNDHTILPEEKNEREYRAYGPLFLAIKGKQWVLEPGVVTVETGDAKANVFETPRGRVVFVGLAGNASSARITVRGLPDRAHLLHPGQAESVTLQGRSVGAGVVDWNVPLTRGCALLVMNRA